MPLDPAWQRLCGQPATGGCNRAYLERGRGHSKTTDLAVMSTWALLSSKRRLAGIGVAADKDQARLLRNSIARVTALNPWLRVSVQDIDTGQARPWIDVQSYRIRNATTGSTLEIISCDVGSSFGLTPDFVICDELVMWQDEDLWVSLLSAAAKRRDCLLAIISNAGMNRGTAWQWRIREHARLDDGWYFHSLSGPVASWITEDRLLEQRRLLPPSAYTRLWGNRWSAGGDLFAEEQIKSLVTCDGPMPAADPKYGTYIVGVDIGLTKHHSSVVVLAIDHATHHVRVALVIDYKPPVDLEDVFKGVLRCGQRFDARLVVFDPYQAVSLAQRWRRVGMRCQPMPATSSNMNRMALALLEVIREQRLDLYADRLLLSDLMGVSIEERQTGGYRLRLPENEHGHGDRLSALATALPLALKASMRGAMGNIKPAVLMTDRNGDLQGGPKDDSPVDAYRRQNPGWGLPQVF